MVVDALAHVYNYVRYAILVYFVFTHNNRAARNIIYINKEKKNYQTKLTTKHEASSLSYTKLCLYSFNKSHIPVFRIIIRSLLFYVLITFFFFLFS